MGWEPASTQLNTVDEFNNISHTITYSETTIGIGGSTTTYDVVVTAIDPNGTISAAGNTISGFYSDSFTNDIQYRTQDNQFVNVRKWSEIDRSKISEVVYYKADTTTRKVYSYLARASNGATQTYTINVDNNWSSGRDSLLNEVNYTLTVTKPNTGYTPNVDAADGETIQGFYPGKFKEITLTWVNNNKETVVWKNKGYTNYDWVNFV
jgi:hypothetical protein